jgi:hypothetical protein
MCKQKAKKKGGDFISQARMGGPTKRWFSINVV